MFSIQSVALNLLGNQEISGDIEFFNFRIPWQADDFHAVLKGQRNVGQGGLMDQGHRPGKIAEQSVEQLQTDGFHRRYDAHPAGFGPYECARLGRETGGIFFMLPSLETNLVRGEKRQYDIQAPYYPDLRSKLENKVDIKASPLRTMLEKVIYDLDPYNPEAAKTIVMRVEFPRDYAALVPLARREQASRTIWLTPSLAMSSRIIWTPSAPHSMGLCLQDGILPSRVATEASCLASKRSPMPQPVHR